MVETTERTYSHDGGTVWFRRHRPNDAVVAMCSDEEYAEIVVAALSAYIGEGPDAVPEMADLRAEIDRLTRENAELCAAAPDLLAELKATRGYVVRMKDLCERAYVCNREELQKRVAEHVARLAAIDAAIAKAEGAP